MTNIIQMRQLRAFECYSLRTKQYSLINELFDSNFLNEIIYDGYNEYHEPFLNRECILRLVLSLCREIIVKCPVKSIETHAQFFSRIQSMSANNKKFCNERSAFLAAKNEAESQKRLQNMHRNGHDSLEPPNDFTQMSIIPTLRDILDDQKSFLRKNITNGAYKSVDHYLGRFFIQKKSCVLIKKKLIFF
jgi:hypothetical protein